MANKAKMKRKQSMKRSTPIPTKIGRSGLDHEKAPRGRIIQQSKGR